MHTINLTGEQLNALIDARLREVLDVAAIVAYVERDDPTAWAKILTGAPDFQDRLASHVATRILGRRYSGKSLIDRIRAKVIKRADGIVQTRVDARVDATLQEMAGVMEMAPRVQKAIMDALERSAAAGWGKPAKKRLDAIVEDWVEESAGAIVRDALSGRLGPTVEMLRQRVQSRLRMLVADAFTTAGARIAHEDG